jgi:ankyrin repeat protein
MAAKLSDPLQCRILTRTGVYVNAHDMSESKHLHFAAFYGHLSTVKFLMENARADVNALCDNRALPNPLAWAQYAGHGEIANLSY